jgi:FAD/FMN-containing dehydrogenase
MSQGALPDSASIAKLRRHITGDVIAPADPAYDTERRVWNAMVDRFPALIVQCRNAQDIAAGIDFARSHDLPLTVRGGGHGVAGRAVCDGGVMIDLSRMNEIVIDPERRTAVVQGGARWAELDTAGHHAGLATTGGVVATTGVCGLAMGGGLGFLMRPFGLSCDNIIGAEVVTADGAVLTVDADQHPDLFWALRGGGGNFGVVSSFTFQMHPLQQVVGGTLAFPLADFPTVARTYREVAANAPRDLTLYLNAGLSLGEQPVANLDVCYAGPLDRADRILAPLREFGSPYADTLRPKPYLDVQMQLAEAFPTGMLHYWKSSFIDEISDGLIEVIHERTIPHTSTDRKRLYFAIEQLGGKVAQIAPDATAFSERTAAYSVVIVGDWADPADSDECVAWVRGSWEAIQSFSRSSAYVNYLDTGDEQRTPSIYGPNLPRLAAVKAAYDPDNLFRHNQNIMPARPS